MDYTTYTLRSAFLKAVEADDSVAVKNLLDRGLDPDANFSFEGLRKSAIFLCAEMERTTLVEVLLQAGGNVDRTNCIGMTPLLRAAMLGHLKMVALLLSKGAEVNRRTIVYGHTPLHLAAHGLNVEVVRLLIDAGADVNRRDKAMMTPLVYACTQPTLPTNPPWSSSHDHLHASFLSELLKEKSRVQSRDEKGCTALHHIVRGNSFGVNVEALELLLSHPCDVDARNRFGQTPLYVAARHNSRKAVLLLLKAGCRVDIEARPENNETYSVNWKLGPVNLTPVDIAILHRFYDVAELLLAAGARIKREVWMSARKAIEHADPSMLERLLAAGADCPKLFNLCRRTFYDRYGTETSRLVEELPLLPLIKMYLTFEIL